MTARPMTEGERVKLVALDKEATPGPWHPGCFVDPKSKCQCRFILSEGYCGSIADVMVDNGKNISEGGNDSPPLEEARANAELIAAMRNALPALLSTSAAVRGMREALSGFVEIFADGEEHGGGAHDDECDICLAIQKALAALSGIEGEDEQARPSGSAPISTDTKGTTK